MNRLDQIVAIARAELGIHETPGPASTARIDEYLATVGLSSGDETAWCSAFVNWVYLQAKLSGSGKPNARSWLKWGRPTDAPQPGDVAVFWRGDPKGWEGHVAIFLEETDGMIRVIGGNQHDAVTEASFPEWRLLGFRQAECE